MEEKKGKKEREKQDDAKVRFGIALFFFLASYRRRRHRKNRKEKKLLTATFPWACIRKQGTPRGPPLSGALPRRAPRKEGPLEGGGEQQFRSSTTTTAATDDDSVETEEGEREKQSQLSQSFRAAAPKAGGRCRSSSSRWSKRASSSKPASFFFESGTKFFVCSLAGFFEAVKLFQRARHRFFLQFFVFADRPPKGIPLSLFFRERKHLLSLSLWFSLPLSLQRAELPISAPSQ